MCGRYLFYDGKNKRIGNLIHMAQLHLDKDTFSKVSLHEIFPSQYAFVGVFTSGCLHTTIMQWGYTGRRDSVINARSETAFSSSFFQHSVPCAVIATTYYEWNRDHRRYSFSVKDEPIYMGGLAHKEEGRWKFVILTEEAEEPQRSIHSRQPVLFSYEDAGNWCTSDHPVSFLSHSITHRIIQPA